MRYPRGAVCAGRALALLAVVLLTPVVVAAAPRADLNISSLVFVDPMAATRTCRQRREQPGDRQPAGSGRTVTRVRRADDGGAMRKVECGVINCLWCPDTE